MIFTLPGALMLGLGLADDNAFIAPVAHDHIAKTMAFYMICWSAVTVPFASILGMLILRKDPRNLWDSYVNRPLEGNRVGRPSPWIFVLVSFFIIYMVAFIIVQIETHPSPLYLSFTGSSELEIAQRRIDVTRLYSGSRPIKSLLNLLGPSLLFSCIAQAFSATKNSRPVKFLAIVVGFMVATSALTDSEKSPLIFIILGLVITFIYIGRPISKKIFALIVATMFGTVIIMYYIFFNDVVKGGWLAERLFGRIFIDQIAAVPICAAEYPRFSPFIGLDSIDSIIHKQLGIVPAPRATEYLLLKHYPTLAEAGGWNVNGFFIHEAWANFGMPGLALAPFLVGFIHASAVVVFCRIKKSPIMVGIFAYISADITLFITGFNRYLLNTGVLHILLLLLAAEIFRSIADALHTISASKANLI